MIDAILNFIIAIAALARGGVYGRGYYKQTDDGPKWIYEKIQAPLQESRLKAHLHDGKGVAVYPTIGDEASFAVIDLDDHKGNIGWSVMLEWANRLARSLEEANLKYFPIRSGGGNGIHLYLLWNRPQKAGAIRDLLERLIAEHGLTDGTAGIENGEAEIYPRERYVAPDKFGRCIALLFSRKSAPLDLNSGVVADLATYQPPSLESLFNDDLPPPAPVPADPKPPKDQPSGEASVELREACREALELVCSDDYDTWFKVGLALKHTFDGEGEDLFHAWSSKSEKYDERGCADKWRGFAPDGRLTIGTIFKLARDAGWVPTDVAAKAMRRNRKLDRKAPLDIARRFVTDEHTDENGATLAYVQDQYWRYHLGRYGPVEPKAIDGMIYTYLDGSVVPTNDGLAPFKPKASDVHGVLHALAPTVLVYRGDGQPPYWRAPASGFPPRELIPFRNGLLHAPTMQFFPPNSQLFSTHALDLDYVADAPKPAAFLAFVRKLWPDDEKTIALLQEQLGYLLVPDTSQHKIFLWTGPPRAGKGTLVRVLEGVLGQENICSLQMADLGTQYGMQGVIGKSLVVFPDARVGSKGDQSRAVERLLSISGEDVVSIPRKFMGHYVGRLPARLLIVSNEIPKLHDPSGALAGRMAPVVFDVSFAGREDRTLSDKLSQERLGILHWALEGWRRLRERGHFELPERSVEELAVVRAITAPLTAFVDECCEADLESEVSVDAMYEAYTSWATKRGVRFPDLRPNFGIRLRAAAPWVKHQQVRREGGRTYVYAGVRLLARAPADDPDPDRVLS